MFKSEPLRLTWTKDLPQHWNDSSPFKTHFLNALSINFPEGERFFIDAIKPFRDSITDPQQLAEIDEFIKQENWHRYLHIQYNDWLETLGLPAKSIESNMNDFWRSMTARLSPYARLAATVAIEHITATNAELFLKYRTNLKRMDPHFEQVWRWHGIEEIEHKSVAMNVWNAFGGKTRHRRLAMLLVLVYYSYYMTKNTCRLLQAEGNLFKWRTVKDAWNMLFDPLSGIVRCSAKYMWDFMRKDWHPDQTDHSVLLKYSKV